MRTIKEVFGTEKPIIALLHLRALQAIRCIRTVVKWMMC